MQKPLNDLIIKIQTVSLFSAGQNDAINTFIKLRLHGMTEDQILRKCRAIEVNGHNLHSN